MIPTSGLHMDQAPPLSIPARFFVTAPIFMILAGVLFLVFGDDLFITPLAPWTVVLVHLAVLGWITMTMFGAIYQMIPVLGGVRVPWFPLAKWVHALLVMGIISMALGIGADLHPWLLLVASAGLGGALIAFLLQVGTALARTPSRHPTIIAMRLSVIALALTLLLGAVFLGEYAHGFLDIDRFAMVGTHLTWGLFGWIGLLILGVSFQVFPMFYMTPDWPVREAQHILMAIGGTLMLMPIMLFLVADRDDPLQQAWFWAAALPGVAAMFLYGITMRHILVQRRRKQVDSTLRFVLMGFFWGALALCVILAWPVTQGDERWRHLFGVLYLLGCVTTILIGMLYKIVPFLVWFHRFSRLAGLVKIPMMDDLIPERVAKAHGVIHGGTVVLCAVATLLTESDWPVIAVLVTKMAGAGLMISGGALWYMLYFALRQKPPELPEMPSMKSFFEDIQELK